MKRTTVILALFASLAVMPSPLPAQVKDEGRFFMEMAGGQSSVFRSRQAKRYNFSYDGTYYWDGPEFERGGLMLNGKWFDGILLNVDACDHEVFAMPDENRSPVVIHRDIIDWFTIGGYRYVNLNKKGYAEVPPGFYCVEYEDGYTVYSRMEKRLNNDLVFAGSGAGIIQDYFEPVETFWIEDSGTVTPLRKRRTLKYLDAPEGRNFMQLKKSSKNDVHRINAIQPEELLPAIPDQPVTSASLPKGDFKIGDKSIYTSLPAGFFLSGEDTRDDELLKLINAGHEVATFANKVYYIGMPENAHGDKAFVSGTVRDVLSGQPMIGVAVFDSKGKSYAMTDNDGLYRIQLPLGDNTLNFSGYSLEDLSLSVVVDSDGDLDVVMKEKITSLKGAVVSAESMTNHRDARMGIEKVRINTIQKVPAAFGEADVLKVVLTLPGVKSVGEASSGFNVRGGSTDQNLVLFNDGTIYNPSHLFGIFSAFNTDVINDVELYKSSIPAEFGGRISSVLDVRGREGNSNKLQGSLGLGLLTSRFHLEGPLGEKTTFIAGGRTTYSDWLMKLLPENSAYNGGGASFSDLNLSVTHRVNDKNTIQAYGYWSRDRFSFDGDTTFHYSNLNASLKWRSSLSQRTTMTLAAGYDQYSNEVDDAFNAVSGYIVENNIDQLFAKLNFKTILNDRHSLSYGAQSIYYMLNPGHMKPLSSRSIVVDNALPWMHGLEPAFYAGDTWTPDDRLSVDMGLRLSSFKSLSPSDKFHASPELRLSGKYSFRDNLSVKAGFNTMNQYIHLISNTASVSPMDAWHLVGDGLAPQKGWQAASGLYWSVNDNKIDLSLEAYYKRGSNNYDYKSGATLIMNENLAADLVPTFAKAYGVEFMAKKPLGKLNGWLSYTYSRSLMKEMEDRGSETINGGAWYNAPHDKPHDVKMVGNYKFTHRYSLSFNLDYSTGRPVTLPVSSYYYGGGRRLAYSLRNGYRVPDYFRLDLALNIDPGHYLRQLTHMTWTLGVYNVTGRKNAYSIYYSTDGGKALTGYKLAVFACPIPYINLNIKFG